jgi:hypothetical protein
LNTTASNAQVDAGRDLKHPRNVRTCVLTISVACCIAAGCGGDDEPVRPAESKATETAPKPVRTDAGTPSKEPPRGQTAEADSPEPAKRKPPASKPPKDSRARSGGTQAPPAPQPGSAEDAEEAQRKARDGVPSLGSAPDQ